MNDLKDYTGIIITNIKPIIENETVVMRELFKGITSQQQTVFRGMPGTEFGNHFHKPTHPFKNPERNYVVSGKGIFKIIDLRWNKEIELEKRINEGDEIIIEAGVYHALIPLTPITLLENLSVTYNPSNPNTFKGLEEYKNYIKSIKN